jgi:hypothetical protein
MDRIDNDASISSSIVACVVVVAVTFLPSGCLATIRGFLPCRCLATIRGYIRGIVNNFVEWPHSGAVMHFNQYMEPRDGAMSVLLSSQKEAVACVLYIQKECHYCKG